MNEDMVKKNLEYQEQITQIAKMLFHAFYYDEEEMLTSQTSWSIYEKLGINNLMEKADKVLHHLGSVEDAKKTIRFLQTVNPIKGREIIEQL